MNQYTSVALLLYAFATILQGRVNDEMAMTTYPKFFIQHVPIHINCTSSVPVSNGVIQYRMGGNIIISIRYYESTGKCLYLQYADTVPNECNANCGCDLDGRSFLYKYSYEGENTTLELNCIASSNNGILAGTLVLKKAVPITAVTMTTTYATEVENIISGEVSTFNCTTDPGRPAAWIQWYIGEHNMTSHSTFSVSTYRSRFIAFSTLVYTGTVADHGDKIFCEAVNIEGRQKLRSEKRSLYIHVPVSTLTLSSVGVKNIVNVAVGEERYFTCTTDSIRPHAWIHWYIGIHNVTNNAVTKPPQSDGSMFISSSKLKYIGKEDDNNMTLYCEASNVGGRLNVKSKQLIINTGFHPDPVFDVKAICQVEFSVVMWRSEANGGHEQLFQVVWQNLKSEIVTRSNNVSDPGNGFIVHYIIQTLSPKSYYTINIESTNIYGTVRSKEQVHCNTSGTVISALPASDPTLSYSAGFGSGSALIIIINIVSIIAFVVIKRKRRAFGDRGNVYEQTENRTRDANVYNELNEIKKGRNNLTGRGDLTYDDIHVDGTPNQTSDIGNRRKIGTKSK